MAGERYPPWFTIVPVDFTKLVSMLTDLPFDNGVYGVFRKILIFRQLYDDLLVF